MNLLNIITNHYYVGYTSEHLINKLICNFFDTGLNEIRDTMRSWDWCYGKTPKFTVTRSYAIPPELLRQALPDSTPHLTVKIIVVNGLIEEVFLNVSPSILPGAQDDIKVISNLEGRKYADDAIEELEISLKDVNILTDDNKQLVSNCFRTVRNLA